MKRNFKVFAQRTYTAIEPQWDVRPPDSSGEPAYERLEYDCRVATHDRKRKAQPRAVVWGDARSIVIQDNRAIIT